MNQKILIIGGSGLLGSYLTKWFLEKGYTDITATYSSNAENITDAIRDGVNWQPLTLPDKERVYALIPGHEWIIHAGGFVSYHPKDKNQLLDINTTGTAQIVNACLENDVNHLVYIGSKSALGRDKDAMPLNENAAWTENEFTTQYGLSKYLGELEVWRGVAEGLAASVILPSVMLGTGNWNHSSLQMVRRIASGSKWYPGGATGFVDVRDVVFFIDTLLQKGHIGERWLLSGFNASFEEMYHSFGKALDVQTNFQKAPKWLAHLMLRASSFFQRKTIGTEIINQSYARTTYDASKSLQLEGFRYVPAEKSIAEIAAIFQQQENRFLPFSK